MMCSSCFNNDTRSGFYFFISIFFAPILASIPPWAIGGALIIVGSLMARSLTKLKFEKVSHAVSGFLTVMVMPLTYSITYGLLAGIGAFVIIEGVCCILSLVGLKVPEGEHYTNAAVADTNENANDDAKPSSGNVADEQVEKAPMEVDEEEAVEVVTDSPPGQ